MWINIFVIIVFVIHTLCIAFCWKMIGHLVMKWYGFSQCINGQSYNVHLHNFPPNRSFNNDDNWHSHYVTWNINKLVMNCYPLGYKTVWCERVWLWNDTSPRGARGMHTYWIVKVVDDTEVNMSLFIINFFGILLYWHKNIIDAFTTVIIPDY